MPFSTVRSSGSSYSNQKHLIKTLAWKTCLLYVNNRFWIKLQCWASCANYSLPDHCSIILHHLSLFQCCFPQVLKNLSENIKERKEVKIWTCVYYFKAFVKECSSIIIFSYSDLLCLINFHLNRRRKYNAVTTYIYSICFHRH